MSYGNAPKYLSGGLLLTIIVAIGVACGGSSSTPTITPAPELAVASTATTPQASIPEPTATATHIPTQTPAPTSTPTAIPTPTITPTATPIPAPAPTSTALPATETLPALIPREAIFALSDKTDVKISPNGELISYRAPVCGPVWCVMNVWVAPVDNLSAAEPVTQETTDGIRGYFWAFTNKHILYRQDTDGDEDWRIYSLNLTTEETRELTPPEGVQAQIQGVSPKFQREILVNLNDRDSTLHDLYRINIETGETTLVRRNERFFRFVTDSDYNVRFAMDFTPDGGFELLSPTDQGGWERFTKIAMEDSFTTFPVGFDETGEVLYMWDSRDRNTAAVTEIDLNTGRRTVIIESAQADVSAAIVHPTEMRPLAAAFTYERKHWRAIDKSVQPDLDYLGDLVDGDFEIVSQSFDNKRWIVSYIVDDGPERYYYYDRDQRKAEFLFTTLEELEDLTLAKLHPVIIKSRDGLDLVSYLTLPPWTDTDGDARPDKPLGMVLLVHGGPQARDNWSFNPEHQLLANRGYAVLSVNYRGSTGFGKEFINAAIREYAGKMHDDLVDAVDWAVENGIAHRDRIAIMGSSYGGYATLVGLTFTPDVFACGVSFAGPSNLITDLESIPPYLTPLIDLLTTRVGDHRTEEGRAFLRERSPLTYVDQITKPLLIGQGSNDPRVRQSESDQIVEAMQRKGLPVTYLLYPDEGHGFSNASNSASFFAVTEAFLAECLGGRFESVTDDFSGSTITVPVGAQHVDGLEAALDEM